MLEHENKSISIKRQCELLGTARSAAYYKPIVTKPNDDVEVMNEIRSIYLESPFFGYRRMHVELRKIGYFLNHKRVQRLMRLAGIKAIYPKKNTSRRNNQHKVYPYLLRELLIDRPNQVWVIDITYIKIRGGFVYLVCVVDVFSRRIMGSALSVFLDTQMCIDALKEALKHNTPDIINSDQGSQFTSNDWVTFLNEHNIKISMDGKGRWADNIYVERLWRTIKYENVFLHGFDTVEQAWSSLKKFIAFYNQKRPHQSLNYHTPEAIFELKKIPTKQQLFEQFKAHCQVQALGVA